MPTEGVQHVMIPGDLPVEQSGLAGDQDSSTTAADNRAPGGDRFTFGRYERPFNADVMDVYYPYLDIQTSEFYQDDVWFYGVITLKSDESSLALNGNYGFEIDLNVDGGGDLLIMAVQPASTEWTTNGAQVWFDMDDDVGGNVKVNADNSSTGGTGYETMIFGDGRGMTLIWLGCESRRQIQTQCRSPQNYPCLKGMRHFWLGCGLAVKILPPPSLI